MTLVAECGAGANAVTIAICVAEHPGKVVEVVKDITNVIEEIPSTYTKLKSMVDHCDTDLSADIENIKALVDPCL